MLEMGANELQQQLNTGFQNVFEDEYVNPIRQLMARSNVNLHNFLDKLTNMKNNNSITSAKIDKNFALHVKFDSYKTRQTKVKLELLGGQIGEQQIMLFDQNTGSTIYYDPNTDKNIKANHTCVRECLLQMMTSGSGNERIVDTFASSIGLWTINDLIVFLTLIKANTIIITNVKTIVIKVASTD